MQVRNPFAQTPDHCRLTDRGGTGQHDYASCVRSPAGAHLRSWVSSRTGHPACIVDCWLGAELFEQSLALTVAQATQATGRRNFELSHDFLRFDLAHLRQRLQQRRYFHLAQDFIALGVLEHLGEVGTATLEPILELCSCSTRGSSLLQRGRALLVGQLGKGHDSSVSDQSRVSAGYLGPAETTVLTLPDEI